MKGKKKVIVAVGVVGALAAVCGGILAVVLRGRGCESAAEESNE